VAALRFRAKLAGKKPSVGSLTERVLAGFRRQGVGRGRGRVMTGVGWLRATQQPLWRPVDPADPALGWQKHWGVRKLTRVARQETGHTPSRKVDAYWVPEECVTPWVSLADVWQLRSGEVVFIEETKEKVSEVGLANSAARLLPKDTVILSRTASVGFPAILGEPMATTQDFAAWICGPVLRPKFLYFVLLTMRPEFHRLMMGSTHQTIYMPDIRAFRTPLPPVNEQDEICANLETVVQQIRRRSHGV